MLVLETEEKQMNKKITNISLIEKGNFSDFVKQIAEHPYQIFFLRLDVELIALVSEWRSNLNYEIFSKCVDQLPFEEIKDQFGRGEYVPVFVSYEDLPNNHS